MLIARPRSRSGGREARRAGGRRNLKELLKGVGGRVRSVNGRGGRGGVSVWAGLALGAAGGHVGRPGSDTRVNGGQACGGGGSLRAGV